MRKRTILARSARGGLALISLSCESRQSLPSCEAARLASAWRRLIYLEECLHASRNRQVVQRPEGLWFHPARGRVEGRIRPYFGRRAVGALHLARRSEGELRNSAGARQVRSDQSEGSLSHCGA